LPVHRRMNFFLGRRVSRQMRPRAAGFWRLRVQCCAHDREFAGIEHGTGTRRIFFCGFFCADAGCVLGLQARHEPRLLPSGVKKLSVPRQKNASRADGFFVVAVARPLRSFSGHCVGFELHRSMWSDWDWWPRLAVCDSKALARAICCSKHRVSAACSRELHVGFRSIREKASANAHALRHSARYDRQSGLWLRRERQGEEGDALTEIAETVTNW